MNADLTHAAALAKLSHLDLATVHNCLFIGSLFAIMSMIISYLQQITEALTGTYRLLRHIQNAAPPRLMHGFSRPFGP